MNDTQAGIRFASAEQFQREIALTINIRCKSMDNEKIFIIGAGMMGYGISRIAAENGLHAVVYDAFPAMLESCRQKLEEAFAKQVKKGAIKPEEKTAFMERIAFTEKLEDAASCKFVIEAIVEKKEIKMEFFRKLNDICTPDTIIATNTSSIPITELAVAVNNPSRFVGTHFFSPTSVRTLVEIICGLKTNDATLQKATDMMLRLKRDPVMVKDGPGFLVNRINNALRLEAFKCVQEGVATLEDIDKALRLGLGHSMGVFEQMDFTGLDSALMVEETLWEGFRSDKWNPPTMLRKMVASGEYGQKTKGGWYDYSTGEKRPRKDLKL